MIFLISKGDYAMYEEELKVEEKNEDESEIILVEHDDPSTIAALIICFLFIIFDRGIYISEIGLHLNRWLFMTLMGVVITLNIFINALPIWEKQKVDRHIQALLPVEVFAGIFNMQYNFYIGITFLVLSVFTAVVVMISITRSPKSKRQYHILQRLRYPLLATMLISLVLSIAFCIMGDKSIKPTVPTNSDVEMQDNSMIKHEIDSLKALVDGSWETLTTEQKLNTLQVVANIESTYLGCDAMLLAADTLPDGEGGNYAALQKKNSLTMSF